MLIAIYGGSFNPLHFGHTGVAAWVATHTDVDEVWLMVTPNNPLKDRDILADEQQRLAAARQEVERLQQLNKPLGIEHVRVSDFEFDLPRPSYTAHTLRELTNKYPLHKFALLIGQDNWAVRHRWREWDTIEANYPIYVYPRGSEGLTAVAQEIQGTNARVQLLVGAPLFDISSTQLRAQQQTKAQ